MLSSYDAQLLFQGLCRAVSLVFGVLAMESLCGIDA